MSRIQGTRPNRKNQWTPDVPPKEAEDLPNWLFNQLYNLSSTLFNINTLKLDRVYKLGNGYRPRDGDIMLAAEDVIGVSAGVYYYNGVDWVYLG